MSDSTYWIGLAVASAMIVGFVLCFIQNKAARFFVAVILFFTAGSALLWVQHRADDQVAAKLEENRAWLRDLEEKARATADAATATPASPSPVIAAPAPVIARPAVIRRATPDPLAQNEAIRAKYGEPARR